MKNLVEEMDYETPRVKKIIVAVEKGFQGSDGVGTGEDEIG